MTLIKTEIRNLATKITYEERDDYSVELLQSMERVDEIGTRKKNEMDRLKSMATEATGKVGTIRTILRSGEHYRDIQCEVRFNAVDLTEEVFRTDTWERISVRNLKSDEIAKYVQRPLIDGLDGDKPDGDTPPADDTPATDTGTAGGENPAETELPPAEEPKLPQGDSKPVDENQGAGDTQTGTDDGAAPESTGNGQPEGETPPARTGTFRPLPKAKDAKKAGTGKPAPKAPAKKPAPKKSAKKPATKPAAAQTAKIKRIPNASTTAYNGKGERA